MTYMRVYYWKGKNKILGQHELSGILGPMVEYTKESFEELEHLIPSGNLIKFKEMPRKCKACDKYISEFEESSPTCWICKNPDWDSGFLGK